MDHPVQKTKKQIYNQTYADTHGEKMRANAVINYAQNRDKILLRQAHNRYLKGVSLRKDTSDRLIAAGYFISLYHIPKYLQSPK